MSTGASPRTPLGEHTALLGSPSWFQGAASRQEGNGGEGREGLGGRDGKGRERGMGKEAKREKLGDGAMVVGGDRRPWLQLLF